MTAGTTRPVGSNLAGDARPHVTEAGGRMAAL
jgi:hypothetical protein